MSELRDIIGEFVGTIDPHLSPYGAEGDAIYGRDGETDGTNRLYVPGYTFVPEDVNKAIWSSAFGGARTITAIGGAGDPHACTVSGGALGAGGNQAYLFGTDDTAALQSALNAARVSASGYFVGPNVAGLRADVRGRTVMLRSGRTYLVRNPQAAFNAGKTAALYVHRRTALVGPMAFAGTCIITAPDSYGDIVSTVNARAAMADNSTADGFVDFVTMANFTVNGTRGFGAANVKSGVVIYPSFNGYLDTDPCHTIRNVWASQCPEHGFILGGRGELLAHNLRGADNGRYGCWLYGLVDSSLAQSSFGGNRRTGLRVTRSQSIRIVDVKAWYSGIDGGTNEKDCAGAVFEADQARNGKVMAIGLDLQESRGSGLVIDNSGHNLFRGCRVQDGGQQNGLNGGTLPTIRSGIRLIGTGCSENDLDVRVEAGVRAYEDDDWTGTSALSIDAEPSFNTGRVEVQRALGYTTKVEGPGTANGKNSRLMVDGVALT